MSSKAAAEKVVRDIWRETRKQYSAKDKIRIVLEGRRGEESVASLCRREGIADGISHPKTLRGALSVLEQSYSDTANPIGRHAVDPRSGSKVPA